MDAVSSIRPTRTNRADCAADPSTRIKLIIDQLFEAQNAMLYFVRSNTDFQVHTKPPPTGTIYPEIVLGDQVMKLVDQRKSGTSYKFASVSVILPSLLKSNLQKAVRRRAVAAAYASMKHLLAQDANELLRRLPVIMCEDTQLHPRLFMEVVWLMAAVSKGYALTFEDAQIVTDCVSACLSAPAQYNLAVDVTKQPRPDQDPLFLAFSLRIAYGGMKSDMEFLGRLQNRAVAGELPLHTCNFEPVAYMSIPPFSLDAHLLSEAVDFHCFPKMIEVTGVAKKAIWFHRSAPNVRPYTGIGAKEAFEVEEAGKVAHPFDKHDEEAVEDFVAQTLGRLKGRPATVVAVKPKQMRLTGFVIRSSASLA